jgi:hypothetical protein
LTIRQFSITFPKDNLFLPISPNLREGSSEHVPLGASVSQRPATQDVERFLFLPRFDSREKVNALGRYADLEMSKTDN